MEGPKIQQQIYCNVHPKEAVRRVCLDRYCNQSIFCIECILGKEDIAKEHEKLVSLDEFLDTTIKFYEESSTNIDIGTEPPAELSEVFSKESEKAEKLKKHLEQQKMHVENVVQELITKFTQLCLKKRDELVNLLDRELINFKCNYEYFEKQLKRRFHLNRDEEIFPTKQSIIKRMNNVSNSKEFLALVKGVSTDMFDHQRNRELGLRTAEEALRDLKGLAKALDTEGFTLPTIINHDSLSSFNAESILDNKITKLFEEVFQHEESIPDLVTTFGGTLEKTKIVRKYSDVALLKQWINPNRNIHFKLLYSGTRDGFGASDFHKKCFGKDNTLTIVKTEKDFVFGGFLDVAWTKNDAYITSTKSWIFSLNFGKKYKLRANGSARAGWSGASYGPSFGDDFYLQNKAGISTLQAYEVYEPGKLTGSTPFVVKEVEVYKVLYSTPIENADAEKQKKSEKIEKSDESAFLSKKQLNRIVKMVNQEEITLERCYQATKNGFSAENFHQEMDGQSDFVIVIQGPDGEVFGGYTKSECTSQSNEPVSDEKAFLFKFKGIVPTKFAVCEFSEAVVYSADAIITFGNDDLKLGDNADQTEACHSALTEIYEQSDDAIYGTSLGGANDLKIKEFEVFLVKKSKGNEEESDDQSYDQ